MAINVNIPGVGNVQIDNAAQESTLQALIAAVKDGTARNRRADNELAQSLRRQAAIAGDTETAFSSMSRASGQASSSILSIFAKISDGFTDNKMLMESAESGVLNFSKNLAFVATDIARTWAKNFSTLRVEPIQTASNLLTRGINVAEAGITALGTTIGANSPGWKGIPGKVIQGAAGAAGAILRDANHILAVEYQQTAKAYKEFSEMGASFSNGLGDLRQRVNTSGLTFDQYTAVIKANRENVRALGGNLSEGSFKVSQVLGHLATQTGKSGNTLREELLNLGVGLEEQGAIAINYMANMRQLIGADKLRGKSEAELAQETRKYAENLKILSEFTGKDAKAIMDKARQETMRGALMSSLNEKQQQSLMDTFGGMETIPDAVRDNIKNALMQQLTGGTITDPVVAQSKEMTEFVRNLANQVQSGSGDMTQTTIKMTEQLGEQIRQQQKMGGGLGAVTDKIVLFGGGLDGVAGKLAAAYNALGSMTLEPGAAERSRKNQENAAKGGDELTKSFTKTTVVLNDFARLMSDTATTVLPSYAKALETATRTATTGIANAVNLLAGKITGEDFLKGILRELRDLKREFMPRTPNIAPPAANTPTRDKGTLGMTGRLFEVEDFYGKVAKGETVLTQTQLEKLVSGVSNATMSNSVAQPVLNAPTSGLDSINAADSIRQIQNLYSSAMQKITLEKVKTESLKPGDKKSEIPEELTDIIGKFDIIPLTISIDNLSKQVSTNASDQQSLLNQQITKLSELVSAMQDNVRASENIANVLG